MTITLLPSRNTANDVPPSHIATAAKQPGTMLCSLTTTGEASDKRKSWSGCSAVLGGSLISLPTSFFIALRWLTRTSKYTTQECLRCSRIPVFTTTLDICSQTTNHLRKCSCREYSRLFWSFIAVQTAEPHATTPLSFLSAAKSKTSPTESFPTASGRQCSPTSSGTLIPRADKYAYSVVDDAGDSAADICRSAPSMASADICSFDGLALEVRQGLWKRGGLSLHKSTSQNPKIESSDRRAASFLPKLPTKVQIQPGSRPFLIAEKRQRSRWDRQLVLFFVVTLICSPRQLNLPQTRSKLAGHAMAPHIDCVLVLSKTPRHFTRRHRSL